MTSQEQLTALVENQRRTSRAKVKLDHVPTAAEVLALQLREAGIFFVTEYYFNPHRRWRADFSIRSGPMHLLVEVEGGTWKPGGGRHNRAQGFEDDCLKYAEAIIHGYLILRVTTRQVLENKAIRWIRRLVDKARENGQKITETSPEIVE